MSQVKTLYHTPDYKIGNHYWRCVVCFSPFWKTNIVEYQFRPTHEIAFRRAEHWPGYDTNKTDSGLPRTLAKLYASYKDQIKFALDGTEPAQKSLF